MNSNLLFFFLLAEEAASAQEQTIGMVVNIVLMVAIFAVFYFLMIRPQRKKEKEAKKMLEALKQGDRVTTIGGFYGTVQSVDTENDVITLIMGPDKLKLMVARWAIRNVNEKAEENDTPVESDVKAD